MFVVKGRNCNASYSVRLGLQITELLAINALDPRARKQPRLDGGRCLRWHAYSCPWNCRQRRV